MSSLHSRDELLNFFYIVAFMWGYFVKEVNHKADAPPPTIVGNTVFWNVLGSEFEVDGYRMLHSIDRVATTSHTLRRTIDGLPIWWMPFTASSEGGGKIHMHFEQPVLGDLHQFEKDMVVVKIVRV